MKRLILASKSPSRREILEMTNIPFEIEASNYKEDMNLGLNPKDLAIHLSKNKAQDVASRHKNAVVIGVDSFAVYKNKMFGKPKTLEKAKEMLSILSGNVHSAITGFTIIDTNSGKIHSDIVETKVYFKKLSEKDIDNYLAKEDVLNISAAYIIRGLGAVLIERIEGSHSNVIGLPIAEIADALKQFDINFL